LTLQTPRSFNSWLRGQLKEKKMSQRQLALQSGVDHSTISRLIKGDRMPSLGTATKLARGLREISDEADGPAYFATVNNRSVLPTTRVEYALRGDDALTETDVRELMQAYITVRSRRLRSGSNGFTSAAGAGGLRHTR
jgi:transcriptional regulator with XRE-family HTH domain